MTSPHPTKFQLEAWHAREHVAGVEDHLAGCPACRAVLERLDAERAALLAHRSPGAFVRDLEQRAGAEPPPASWFRGTRARLSLGLAAAAGLAFAVLPAGSLSGVDSLPRGGVFAAERTQDQDFVPKGVPSIAVIRERSGEQTLEPQRVSILPGDKLRLRFSLEREQRVSAGILTDDGSWAPLFEGEFGAGSHLPEATLEVDEHPSSGRILLGAPDEVERARRDRKAAHVQVIELLWGEGRDAS